MLPTLRNWMIGLLLLTLVHAPVPWGHCHENLTPQQLVVHLWQYHRHCPMQHLPRGWHSHWLQVKATDDAGRASEQMLAETCDEQTWQAHLLSLHELSPADARFAELADRPERVALDNLHSHLSQQPLFKLYQSFLI